jgi:hypothetical protein
MESAVVTAEAAAAAAVVPVTTLREDVDEDVDTEAVSTSASYGGSAKVLTSGRRWPWVTPTAERDAEASRVSLIEWSMMEWCGGGKVLHFVHLELERKQRKMSTSSS